MKLKNAATKSINKVLKKLNKNQFKKIFYKINAFSCLVSPKLIR